MKKESGLCRILVHIWAYEGLEADTEKYTGGTFRMRPAL